MSDKPGAFTPTAMIITTSIAAFLGGFMFGLYAARGWVLISPDLAKERRQNLSDPVESDESDVEIDDADVTTLLDHAPNWSNSAEADQRDGLRQRGPQAQKNKKKKKLVDIDEPVAESADSNEECKLVLVVRTDLGMTKGSSILHLFPSSSTLRALYDLSASYL
jgi:peptidyl-tRNA hydrolase, PTH2 family